MGVTRSLRGAGVATGRRALATTKPGVARPPLLVNGGYIAGPWYDWICFIAAPVLALVAIKLSVYLGLFDRLYIRGDPQGQMRAAKIGVMLCLAFTQAHLFAVFFRSHLNRKVFRRHPVRFIFVPIVLFTLALQSPWAFAVLTVLAGWWDVYHSSLQTFGLGRIYDRRHGNDPVAGRRADYWFNLVIYAGPILAGVTLWNHLVTFKEFEKVGALSLVDFATIAFSHRVGVRWSVVGVGAAFLVGYFLHYAWLARRGYRIPVPKLVLYGTTALVSIACWGFDTFGHAFFIMNFFHAFQYFAILWWSEGRNMAALVRGRRKIAFVVFLGSAMAYGIWRVNDVSGYLPFLAAATVISILHFWYDGFIWSVRKGEV